MACIFCNIASGEAKASRVYENNDVVAFFDINPTNEYHTLVIPKRHYQDIYDVPERALHEIMSAIKDITDLYKRRVGITNVQIVNSSGHAAQQDVDHIHFHIVPRHRGDGQDIKWRHKEELREKFPEMLEKLGVESE